MVSAHECYSHERSAAQILAAKNSAMNRKFRRFSTVLAFSFLFSMVFSVQAFAASDDMTQMTETVMDWYRLIRDHIAVPFLIISFASCGFQILGSGFLSKSDQAVNAVIERFKMSAIALLVILVLPYLVGSARELLESTAWSPEAIGEVGTEAASPTTASILLPFRFFL